jgi:S-formylglutathione hydrolase FrmB
MTLLLLPALSALVMLVPVLAAGGASGDGWNNPPSGPLPAGVRHATFRSDSMGVDVGYNVYLPPDYATNAARRYPVVYWLHGLGGNETSGVFPADADAAVRAAAVPPLILVSANGGARTRYHDSADGRIMADTLIAKELVAHVDKTYRTIASRAGRSVQGMSMGGNGALKFAFRYPDLFGSAVAFAPALVDGDWMAANDREFLDTMFAGDKERYQREIAASVLRRNAEEVRRQGVEILIVVGTADALLDRARAMHRLLGELKLRHEYVELETVPHDLNLLLGKFPMRGLAFAAAQFPK